MKITTTLGIDDEDKGNGIAFNAEIGDYRVEVNYSTDVMFAGPEGEKLAKLFVEAVCNNNSMSLQPTG